jgi:hypothetical protein
VANILVPILRNGFRDGPSSVALFDNAQRMGAHVMPVHFYSPVPNTRALDESCWKERFDGVPGWDLNPQGQLELLATLGSFAGELEELRNAAPGGDPYAFDWSNQARAFNATDASLYYSVIRHFAPNQVLEIGSGHSTRIAAKACLRRRPEAPALSCIEPYPLPWLADTPGLSRLYASPVQSIDVRRFKELGRNDVLFIDCSHVCKIGSDVNYLFFHVLPELEPGVIVHVHDIFLPWNYPKEWVLRNHCFWNEQYLLLAWLQGNRDLEVMLASHFLGQEYPEQLVAAFPFLSPTPGGSSFWMRRRG